MAKSNTKVKRRIKIYEGDDCIASLDYDNFMRTALIKYDNWSAEYVLHMWTATGAYLNQEKITAENVVDEYMKTGLHND